MTVAKKETKKKKKKKKKPAVRKVFVDAENTNTSHSKRSVALNS